MKGWHSNIPLLRNVTVEKGRQLNLQLSSSRAYYREGKKRSGCSGLQQGLESGVKGDVGLAHEARLWVRRVTTRTMGRGR